MKRRKIKKITNSLVCGFVIIVSLVIFLLGCWIFNNKETNSEVKLADNTGVWLWERSPKAEYLDFAIENGVNEIYYFAGYKMDSFDKQFMKGAIENNIKVYFLCGEKEWLNNDEDLLVIIERYIQFNLNNPSCKFSGIHLDVEPHQFEDFSSNREVYITKLIALIYKLRSKYPNIKFDFDIPFWLDDVISFNGQQKEAYKFVVDYANRTFVMSYRDTATRIFDAGKDEFEYGMAVNKQVFFGVEMGKTDEVETVTFFEEGREYFNREMASLRQMVTNNFNLSIHNLSSWFNLQDEYKLLSLTNYTESTQRILNQDNGFYRTVFVNLTRQSNSSTGIYGNYMNHHLRINLADYSKANNGEMDEKINKQSLECLDELLNKLYKADKTAIIRFAYDGFNGLSNKEPSEDMILTHIAQVCPILNKYPLTITAVEVGLVGKWGEMHSSTLANPSTISKLIDKYLKNLNQGIPVLVRTPKMIYDYLDISVNDIDNYTIAQNSLAYRLGIFNDGYLGSASDLGTYTNREKEINWLEKQTNHIPYGGEVMTGDMSNIENCLPEMKKMHLSYLNYEWNYNTVQDKWVNTYYTSEIGNEELYYGFSAKDYIENHLGYRLVLKQSDICLTNMNNLNIKLNIANVGFGNFNRTKDIVIIIEDENHNVTKYNAGKYNGETEIDLIINDFNLKGNYNVYVQLANVVDNETHYPIEFANSNMYSDTLKANFIGGIKIK